MANLKKFSVLIQFELWQPDDLAAHLIAADMRDALATGLTDMGIDAGAHYHYDEIDVKVERVREG